MNENAARVASRTAQGVTSSSCSRPSRYNPTPSSSATSPSDYSPPERVDPVEAFALRCWARATLVEAGDLDLHEAVDVLQADAMACGLVDSIGQDAVQQIMSAAFSSPPEPVEELLPNNNVASAAEMQRAADEMIRRRRTGPAASTIAALEHLARNDRSQLCAWLATRSPEDRRELIEMLVPK